MTYLATFHWGCCWPRCCWGLQWAGSPWFIAVRAFRSGWRGGWRCWWPHLSRRRLPAWFLAVPVIGSTSASSCSPCIWPVARWDRGCATGCFPATRSRPERSSDRGGQLTCRYLPPSMIGCSVTMRRPAADLTEPWRGRRGGGTRSLVFQRLPAKPAASIMKIASPSAGLPWRLCLCRRECCKIADSTATGP